MTIKRCDLEAWARTEFKVSVACQHADNALNEGEVDVARLWIRLAREINLVGEKVLVDAITASLILDGLAKIQAVEGPPGVLVTSGEYDLTGPTLHEDP